MIQLYGYPLSPPSEAVRIALEEKGLKFQMIGVDLPGRHQDKETFRHMNYLGQIPVLKDGEITVFESNVILEYLDEAYPERPLLPQDIALRAEARQWIAILQVYWSDIRHQIYHEGLLKPLKLLPGPADRKKFTAARKAMIPHLDALETRLLRAKKSHPAPYLLGDYSMVDALYTPTLYILNKADLIRRKYPEIHGWIGRCLARPSAPRWLDRPAGMAAAPTRL